MKNQDKLRNMTHVTRGAYTTRPDRCPDWRRTPEKTEVHDLTSQTAQHPDSTESKLLAQTPFVTLCPSVTNRVVVFAILTPMAWIGAPSTHEQTYRNHVSFRIKLQLFWFQTCSLQDANGEWGSIEKGRKTRSEKMITDFWPQQKKTQITLATEPKVTVEMGLCG